MPFGMTVPGRLGADPELRATKGGTSVAQFRVAVDGYDREAKEKTTTWVRVVMWGARGETIAKLVSKGDAVCFMGTGELKTYENKDGVTVTYLECNASDCALLGSSQGKKTEPKKATNKRDPDIDDDDIPF